jgi:hypothetical protein
MPRPPHWPADLSFEISSQAVIADDVVAGNGGTGMRINNAPRVEMWNNTVVDDVDRPLWVVQDARLASNLSTPGHAPRRPRPDPTVTWLLGPVTLSNNVVGGRRRRPHFRHRAGDRQAGTRRHGPRRRGIPAHRGRGVGHRGGRPADARLDLGPDRRLRPRFVARRAPGPTAVAGPAAMLPR